ncbi:MAG: hypothetical protein IH943_10905 [Acidobacteria bacterium]|nr:hypothetical protein [Acidobacteriota bacterium]
MAIILGATVGGFVGAFGMLILAQIVQGEPAIFFPIFYSSMPFSIGLAYLGGRFGRSDTPRQRFIGLTMVGWVLGIGLTLVAGSLLV